MLRASGPGLFTRARLLVGLALGAVTVALLPEVATGRGVLFDRDIHLYWTSHAEAMVRIVAAGALPFWNPQAGFGEPMLANPNLQLFYPLTLLHLVLKPWWYYSFLVVSHTLLSALGAHALARSLGGSRPAACVAGAAWIASGPFLSLVALTPHFTTAAWLPWVALAARRALGPDGSTRATLAWGGLVALQVLAGSAEMTVLTALVAVVLGLADGAPRTRAAAVRTMRTTALAALVALGLSAAQWVPTVVELGRSRRGSLEEEVRTTWSLHPASLLDVALPVRLDSLPLQPGLRAQIFDSREPFLGSLYLGLGMLALGAAGLASARRRLAWILAGLAVLGLLLALGRHASAYGLLTTVLPPMRVFRYPVKAMVLTAFAVSQLAALGLDAWLATARARRAAALAAALLALAAAAALVAVMRDAPGIAAGVLALGPSPVAAADILRPVAQRLAAAAAVGAAIVAAALLAGRLRWAAPLAAAACVLELVAFNHRVNPTAPVPFYTWTPDTVPVIRPRGDGRLYVFDYVLFEGDSERYLGRPVAYGVPRDGPPRPRWAETLAARVYPLQPVPMTWGIAGSFDNDVIGMSPPEMLALTFALRQHEGTPAHRQLLQLAAVDTVIALHGHGFEDLQREGEIPSLFRSNIHVFRVPGARPRAWLVGNTRVVGGGNALAAISEPGFDPAREAIVEAGPALRSDEAPGTARVSSLVGDRVSVSVETAAPALLVLAEAYGEGWKATVDGVPASVLRVNSAFRGVHLPAGARAVELRYRPRAIPLGLGASLLAALAVLLAARRTSGTPPRPA